jgi:outer membrane protein insertion porin family
LIFHRKTYISRILIPVIFALFFARITFPQESGPTKTKISKISFSGNDYYSSSQLANMFVLKTGSDFSKEQFELDLKNIISNYQNDGYLDCSIKNTEEQYNFDSSLVSLSVAIDEGNQVLIGDIVFEGNKSITTPSLLDKMFTKKDKVLDAVTLSRDIDELLNLYEEKGFTFASINVKEIVPYTDKGIQKLRLVININENEKIKINDVVIDGNTTTKSNVILQEIRLSDDNIVTRENILDIRRALENTGYFESVEQPKIYKYKNSTVLYVKVKEGNTNTFDGIIGYVPPAQNEEKGYFTGLVNLSLKNLFGTGRRIDAKWQKDAQTTQELELRYLEPWVLGYPLNANIGFLQRIQDSTYIKRIVNFKGDALITKNFTASLLANFERVIPTSNQEQPTYTVFDSRLIATGAEIKFDSRDYVYNPTSGILYRTSYVVGQKKIYNASSYPNLDVPGDFTVQKGMIDLDFYYSFFKRQSSLISVHGVEIRSPKLENSDFFRLGGSRSVRGYREEQFLASRAAWVNFEVRYSLTRKTFTSLFYDAGYYKKPQDEITLTPEQKAFIFGYGVGIRIETPLGIFGVSYALGKGDSFLDGKVHFGLINDF